MSVKNLTVLFTETYRIFTTNDPKYDCNMRFETLDSMIAYVAKTLDLVNEGYNKKTPLNIRYGFVV